MSATNSRRRKQLAPPTDLRVLSSPHRLKFRKPMPYHIDEAMRLLKEGHDIVIDGLDAVSRLRLEALPIHVLRDLCVHWRRLQLGYPTATLIDEVAKCVRLGNAK